MTAAAVPLQNACTEIPITKAFRSANKILIFSSIHCSHFSTRGFSYCSVGWRQASRDDQSGARAYPGRVVTLNHRVIIIQAYCAPSDYSRVSLLRQEVANVGEWPPNDSRRVCS